MLLRQGVQAEIAWASKQGVKRADTKLRISDSLGSHTLLAFTNQPTPKRQPSDGLLSAFPSLLMRKTQDLLDKLMRLLTDCRFMTILTYVGTIPRLVSTKLRTTLFNSNDARCWLMLLSLFYVIQGFDDIFTVLLFNVLGGVTHYLKTLQLHKKPHYQLTISPVWCLVATVQQCELSQKFNVFFCPNFQTICFVLQ